MNEEQIRKKQRRKQGIADPQKLIWLQCFQKGARIVFQYLFSLSYISTTSKTRIEQFSFLKYKFTYLIW